MTNDISEKKVREDNFNPPEVAANPKLRSLNLEWDPPRVHQVYEDEHTAVYVAVGYGRSNPVLIIGKDENGCIIVDPGESKRAAKTVKIAYSKQLGTAFFKNTPVKAIIYTHYHDCHIHGASVFADGNEDVAIISQEKLPDNLFSLTGALYNMAYPIKAYRAIKYMGLKFQSNSKYFVNGGVFSHSQPGHSGYIPPTITVKDELTTTIAGVNLNLIYAPGETTDIIFVWLPNEKVLVQIGDFYKSFPAITTLRGASFRNPIDYIKSIDKMISLDAEHLILIHGGTPLNGKNSIREILTGARDANQYIHDQTLQCMNRGMTPGEIIDHVKLPDYLGKQEYVQEYFGDIERVIFQIFSQYMGWFSGKSRDIFPISTLEQAKASAYLAGSEENLLNKAQEALENSRSQWALIFADDVLLLNQANQAAREIKHQAMLELAAETINAQTRNYLLSEYLEESGQKEIDIPAFNTIDEHMIPYMPTDNIFKIMGIQLDAAKSLDAKIVVGLNDSSSSSSDSGYTMEIRQCILEVKQQKPDNPKFTIIVESYDDWKKVILGKVTPQDAIENNTIKINGGTDEDFYNFMDYFLISYVENSKK